MSDPPAERIAMPVSVEQCRDLAPMETARGKGLCSSERGRTHDQSAHRLRPQLSVLVMTGFAEMAAKFGREITCLRKPFRMSDLRMALATVTLATESGRSH